MRASSILLVVAWALALGPLGAMAVAGCGSDGAGGASPPDDGGDGRAETSRDPDGRGDVSDGASPPADASGDASPDASAPCPPGATLLHDRRACPADAGVSTGAFAAAAAAPGDVVAMGFDEGALPCVPVVVCRPEGAPTMLFSDDPESPTADGVLYADTVGPGRFRLYVYHANGGATARKFPVVVLNPSAAAARVTIRKKGLAAPSTDYVGVGKAVAAAWLDSTLADVVTVPAGARVLLDAALDAKHAARAELVHAIYDVELDAPLKISFVSLGIAADAATATGGLSLLPADNLHDRGTFPGADVSLVATEPILQAGHLRLGDNVTEDDLVGTDATTGAAKKLGGNYGVFYTFSASSAGGVVLAASPRGGEWGGVAQPASGAPSLLLPKATTSLASTTRAAWIGASAPGAVSAALVTAGGSNLPLDLVVVPR